MMEQTATLQAEDRVAVGNRPRSSYGIQFCRKQYTLLSALRAEVRFINGIMAAFPAHPGNNCLGLAIETPVIQVGECTLPYWDAQAEKGCFNATLE